jgi:hypothetical protein
LNQLTQQIAMVSFSHHSFLSDYLYIEDKVLNLPALIKHAVLSALSGSTAAPRPFKAFDCNEFMASLREHPPWIARSLFVILQDDKLLELDPKGTLTAALHKSWQVRLANAKVMTPETPCLLSVDLPARLRFLELVAASEVPYGKPFSIYPHKCKRKFCFSLVLIGYVEVVACDH